MWWKFLIAIVATFILTEILDTCIMRRQRKKLARTLADTVRVMFECTEKCGYASAVDYMLKEKGEKQAIYYFGTVYSLLNTYKSKDEDIIKLQEGLETYLKQALAADIVAFREDSDKRSQQLKEALDSMKKEKQ